MMMKMTEISNYLKCNNLLEHKRNLVDNIKVGPVV